MTKRRMHVQMRLALFLSVLPVSAAALTMVQILEPERMAFNPHGDPVTGVHRVLTVPSSRGECTQCHELHDRSGGMFKYPHGLFAPNNNSLCYAPGGASPCHQVAAPGYPADESDRVPEGLPGAGYFEVYAGGARAAGVGLRDRWPGAVVFEEGRTLTGGHYASPHRSDPDMPRKDEEGRGLCLNCHDPHGSMNQFDILVDRYEAIGGWEGPSAPSAHRLCFGCHGRDGSPGMEVENRWIEDYYDEGLQGDGTAGHQIRLSPKSALSWPSSVRRGDRLPCYDCHNPHGSQGHNRAEPNAFLISDEREGWSGLVATTTDPAQNRRFCRGCHILSDGIPGSVVVHGIVMNTIPSNVAEHASQSRVGCFECHGGSYTTATDYNVHHPRIP